MYLNGSNCKAWFQNILIIHISVRRTKCDNKIGNGLTITEMLRKENVLEGRALELAYNITNVKGQVVPV
jgi:hypothetical protein